jgi:hypothetical protein
MKETANTYLMDKNPPQILKARTEAPRVALRNPEGDLTLKNPSPSCGEITISR